MAPYWKKNSAPALILLAGIAIAAGIFVFSDFSAAGQNAAAAPPQWTQEAGNGIFVPACSSSSTNATCSGSTPQVTISWSPEDHLVITSDTYQICAWSDISISGGPSWSNQPCTSTITWGGAVNNTTYTYTIQNWTGTCLQQWPQGGGEYYACGGGGVGDPVTLGPPSIGSFTTPNCAPLSASCSVSPTSATLNQSVAWTASPSGGTSSYTYSWLGTDGLSGTTQSVQKSYSTEGTKTGSVAVTSGSQTVTASQCSGLVNGITVYQPTLVIVPPSASVQADSTVQLTTLYDPDGPSGPSGEQTMTASSNWSSSNEVKATVNNTSQKGLVTGSTPGSATISAVYTDAYNNTITATAAITVTAQPALSCSPASQTVLIGQTASLSASGGTGNYQWSAPGGSPSSGNNQSFSTVYSSSDTKTVTVSSGSQSADCSVLVSLQTLPDFVIQSLSVPPNIVPGSTVWFTGFVKNQGAGSAPSYTGAHFCLDNPNCLTSSAGRVGNLQYVPILNPGSSHEVVANPPTWTATLGSYTIYLCADVDPPRIDESNETNNCSSSSFTVTQPPSVTPNPPTGGGISVPPGSGTNPGTLAFGENPAGACNSPLRPTFSWTYSDPEGDPQSAYEIEVDNNSGFSSPEIDTGKTSGTVTSYQAASGVLNYNTTYYWRVRVWDSKDAVSDWANGPNFSTQPHQAPTTNYTWSPTEPNINQNTKFTDQSSTFGGSSKQSWTWAFTDANPSSASTQNPDTKFQSGGNKATSLILKDSSNLSCGAQKTVTVKGASAPSWEEVPPE